jgi:hypothetical protein
MIAGSRAVMYKRPERLSLKLAPVVILQNIARRYVWSRFRSFLLDFYDYHFLTHTVHVYRSIPYKIYNII